MTKPENLSHHDNARLLMDIFHRIIVHYGLWFTEIHHQMGPEKALEALAAASEKSIQIQLKRLGKALGYDMQDGVPTPLLNLSEEKLSDLTDKAAMNWLANDGVWFQAVEFTSGMTDAKRCNDSCWAHFSPFEAAAIKKFLNMGAHPGLEGLKTALAFRIYSRINTQSIVDDGPDGFVYQMNECRVQAARKRKGLDDYPCKSGGTVEYTYFAGAVDSRIKTECVGCPPDPHPDEWFCAWRFYI